MLYTDGTAGHNDYVYVASVDKTGGVKKDLEADAYFIDGTNKVIVIDNDEDIDIEKLNNNNGIWFSYNEKSNGKYELSKVEDDNTVVYYGSAINQVITETGKSSVYVGDKSGNAQANTVRANNNTIFIVNDDDDVTAYTGIKNVPDITAKTDKAVVAVVMDGNYADVVYIYSKDMSISGDSGDRVYILDPKPDASVDNDDNKYYEYDAIVNGKIGTIKATSNNLAVGLYQNVSYDENGYMDDQDPVKEKNNNTEDDYKAYTVNSTISYSGGVLTFGDTDIVLADNYTIFLNDGGDGKTTTPSKLARDYEKTAYNGTIYVYENDNDEAVEVYVMDQTTGEDEGNEGIKTDYTFDTLSAKVADDKSFEFTATCGALSTWDMNGVTVEYKVAVNNGTARSYTQKLGDISFSQLAGKMDIPGLTGSETKEYAIDVLVTFKGNDGNSYTIGGSCYM